jgi:MoxR-like ATPase
MSNCERIIKTLKSVILDKEEQIKLALTCIIAKGHLLIEDLPGMGKTTLANALSQVLGLDSRRVQFTADMLPADLTGGNIYNEHKFEFEFHPGPVFTNMLLADEINRGSPRTQSALLEVMAEQQVSNDRTTYKLPAPFFVIATQNPLDQAGTFPLPESQLDRFTMRIGLGYPSRKEEIRILKGENNTSDLTPVITKDELISMQNAAELVFASDSVLGYIIDLCEASRTDLDIPNPLSPRASKAILACAKAYAYIEDRDYITPNDVQKVFPYVTEHRLRKGTVISLESLTFSQKLLHKINPIV